MILEGNLLDERYLVWLRLGGRVPPLSDEEAVTRRPRTGEECWAEQNRTDRTIESNSPR